MKGPGRQIRVIASEADANGRPRYPMVYGRKFKGVIRSTFLIGPSGKITRADYKVKAARHVEDVVRGFSGAP